MSTVIELGQQSMLNASTVPRIKLGFVFKVSAGKNGEEAEDGQLQGHTGSPSQ